MFSFLAVAAILPTVYSGPLLDLTWITEFFTANLPVILLAIGAVGALGLIIGLTMWATGKIPSVLKKTAK